MNYYLMLTPFIPKDVRCIKQLNSRNGRFIDPPLLTDLFKQINLT